MESIGPSSPAPKTIQRRLPEMQSRFTSGLGRLYSLPAVDFLGGIREFKAESNLQSMDESMQAPPKPPNEKARLAALRRLNILDTPPEQLYDDIVLIASLICEAPIALISFVDEDRQWFKAKVGIQSSETARDISFCAYAILGEDIFTVNDATQDDRFADNPLVENEPMIRFYSGAPLQSNHGENLGTLCVIDNEARNLTTQQEDALKALARVTVQLLERRK